MSEKFDTTAYRFPNEQMILAGTIVLVLAVIGLTATATVCMSVIFVVFVLVYAYYGGISHHQQLTAQAELVTQTSAPGLTSVVHECTTRLQVEPVDVFVLHHKALNAYTFGLSSPKAIVLYDSLLQVMDRKEIQFILGHEMGHVKLGHTWLNSLVGGMAGIPGSGAASLILVLALRWWNRACEFSADRAGLLACADPYKAVSALVKVEIGSGELSPETFQRAMAMIDAQDDQISNNLSELLATHPMAIKRINNIRDYVRTSTYQTLQARVNSNLA
jgi:Zn-dependent protease with chaperone function